MPQKDNTQCTTLVTRQPNFIPEDMSSITGVEAFAQKLLEWAQISQIKDTTQYENLSQKDRNPFEFQESHSLTQEAEKEVEMLRDQDPTKRDLALQYMLEKRKLEKTGLWNIESETSYENRLTTREIRVLIQVIVELLVQVVSAALSPGTSGVLIVKILSALSNIFKDSSSEKQLVYSLRSRTGVSESFNLEKYRVGEHGPLACEASYIFLSIQMDVGMMPLLYEKHSFSYQVKYCRATYYLNHSEYTHQLLAHKRLCSSAHKSFTSTIKKILSKDKAIRRR